MLGLGVQNFVSAATGIAVLFAVIRGLVRVKANGLGNFWVDMTRTVLYILIPLSILVTVGIASQGVVQTFKNYDEVKLLEPIVLDDGCLLYTSCIIEEMERENRVFTVTEVGYDRKFDVFKHCRFWQGRQRRA